MTTRLVLKVAREDGYATTDLTEIKIDMDDSEAGKSEYADLSRRIRAAEAEIRERMAVREQAVAIAAEA